MKNKIVSIVAVILLSACGSTKKLDMESLSREKIPAGHARIIVERNTSLLYFGAAAAVDVNGGRIASLAPGGQEVMAVPAGNVTISVSTPAAFGKFSLNIKVKAGEEYKFIISPRGSALIVGSTFGILGDAVAASVSENSGYFQIVPKGSE